MDSLDELLILALKKHGQAEVGRLIPVPKTTMSGWVRNGIRTRNKQKRDALAARLSAIVSGATVEKTPERENIAGSDGGQVFSDLLDVIASKMAGSEDDRAEVLVALKVLGAEKSRILSLVRDRLGQKQTMAKGGPRAAKGRGRKKAA